MNKRLLAAATGLLLATGTFLAPAAVAGPYGCNAWPSQGSHAIASYCPYYAPYGGHQGIGTLWFDSGYSKSIRTIVGRPGQTVETAYFYGAHVTSYSQKLY